MYTTRLGNIVSLNLWMNMLVWLCRSRVREENTDHVIWRRHDSGFKIDRQLTCIFHNCSVFLLLKHYIQSQSYLKCQDDFGSAFRKSRVLNKAIVGQHRWVALFRKTGSVSDRKISGRPTELNDASMENIQHSLAQSPRKSGRKKKLSRQTGLSHESVQKATRKLKFRSYRIRVVHELKDPGLAGGGGGSFSIASGLTVSSKTVWLF